MTDQATKRDFQLWEYHVSHGSLLIRSPAGPGVDTTIDIICVGVEYIAAPRHLRELVLASASESDLRMLEAVLRKPIPPSRARALVAAGERFLVVAAAITVREHSGSIFASPFDS